MTRFCGRWISSTAVCACRGSAKEQIRPRANFREKVGMKRWAEQVEGLVGSLAGKRVGIDIWDLNMEAAIREAFPKTKFADGYQSVLMRAKEIKTQDEILCLKIANAITEAALDRAIAALAARNQGVRSPGDRLGDHDGDGQRMDAVLEYRLLRAVYRSLPAIYFGPNHSQRRPGDHRHRRWLQRLLGRPDAHLGLRQRKADGGNARPASEVLRRAVQCGGKVRPGATNAEVFAAADPYVLDSLGHGSGVNPWEAPYFSPASKDAPVVLKEGMAFNLEPYAGDPKVGGIRLENNHIVTEDGVEIYTTYPFDERLVNESASARQNDRDARDDPTMALMKAR